MKITPKVIRDPLVLVLQDAIYRAGHVPHVRDWIDGLGLTEARRRWRVGASYIVTDGDRWEAVAPRKGRLALVCPALAPELSPYLEDLIASDPERPRRWYSMTGHGVFLGRDVALHGLFLGRVEASPRGVPVAVHRDPLEWARAAGEGIVVLHPARAHPYLTGDKSLTLAARDRAHGRAIELALQTPVVMPEIVVQVAA